MNIKLDDYKYRKMPLKDEIWMQYIVVNSMRLYALCIGRLIIRSFSMNNIIDIIHYTVDEIYRY